jgi:hypothetical protein
MMRRLLALVAIALLAAPGLARAASPAIIGASAQQREALDHVLAGMPGTAIQSIGLRTGAGTKGLNPPGTVLLSVHAAGGDPLRNLWEEWMLGAAFRDASAAGHLTPVTAVVTDVDARRVPKPSTTGPPSSGPAARAQLERSVRAAVAASGATLKNITLLAPRGLAVAARLQTSDPGGFLENQAIRLVNRMNAIHPVGWYLELVDGKGAKAWIGQVSAPAGYEGEWLRSDLQGCDPFAHPKMTGYKPPPCPAL